jgi:carbamate kinase
MAGRYRVTPRPLTVIALGGNLISPPAGSLSVGAERAVAARSMGELAPLAEAHRLLIVHGNGPQVGRLLAAAGEGGALDVAVAQSQGELGYLLCEALDAALGATASLALVTRVLVDPADPAFATPAKPIGPVRATAPAEGPAARTPDGHGWRRVVASPRPRAVLELDAIRAALTTHHVVAGGGGGVPLAEVAGTRVPRAAVVDKDHVAALLATALGAVQFVEGTGRSAVITTTGALAPALAGAARTTTEPDPPASR